MAVSTATTTLNYKVLVGDSYAKLCDILSYPDLGSAPSKLDTTDLAQTSVKTNILGLADAPDLTFECNYDETAFNTINALSKTAVYFLQLLFGTDGEFTWTGQIRAYVTGGGVDEVRKMSIVISTYTPIVFAVN
jgi:hypothetical protein